ncbi:MAG: hypothetical protein E7388_03300 [Ruminococcaceae bacterium]|nr:hypothetical protein [Oscillospiraceae bacterium]
MNRRLKKILVVLLILILSGACIAGAVVAMLPLLGINVFNENDDFTIHEEKNGYILQDYHQNYDGDEMVGFVISDKEGNELYKSPDVFLAWHMQTIFFDQDNNVIVVSGDDGAITYWFDGTTWKR